MQNETWFKLFESAYNDGIDKRFTPDEARSLARATECDFDPDHIWHEHT